MFDSLHYRSQPVNLSHLDQIRIDSPDSICFTGHVMSVHCIRDTETSVNLS